MDSFGLIADNIYNMITDIVDRTYDFMRLVLCNGDLMLEVYKNESIEDVSPPTCDELFSVSFGDLQEFKLENGLEWEEVPEAYIEMLRKEKILRNITLKYLMIMLASYL